jgi:hypothetical protein
VAANSESVEVREQRQNLQFQKKIGSSISRIPQHNSLMSLHNYCVFGHCPSSCSLFKTQRFGDWSPSPSSSKTRNQSPKLSALNTITGLRIIYRNTIIIIIYNRHEILYLISYLAFRFLLCKCIIVLIGTEFQLLTSFEGKSIVMRACKRDDHKFRVLLLL